MTPPRTPAQEAALRAFQRAVIDAPDAYPEDATFLPIDQLDDPRAVIERAKLGRALVIVTPDGHEVHLIPRRRRTLASILRLRRGEFDVDLVERIFDAPRSTATVHAPKPAELQRALACHG